MLDLGSVVGDAGDPVHGLADHDVETPVGSLRFGEQSVDAAISVNGQIESLVRMATASKVQVGATGLDVEEVRHDHHAVRQPPLTGGQLPWKREGRILLVIRRHPSSERHSNRSARGGFLTTSAQPIGNAGRG
jgi:hypothetical protein